MTIREFYRNIRGDYDGMRNRLPTDALILRFVSRFPADKTYSELMRAAADGDGIACFEAAHQLKGVAANLAFSELFDAASKLAEQLRPGDAAADPELLRAVSACYQTVSDEIARLTESKNA